MSNSLDTKPDSNSQLPMVGIICMQKKSSANPMQNILKLVSEQIGAYVEFCIFTDDELLNQDINDWPVVFAAIAFYSTGFPIEKVRKYVRMHRVTIINGTLLLQKQLFNRGCIKDALDINNIPECDYFIVHRQRIFCSECEKTKDYLDAMIEDPKKKMRCWCETSVYETCDQPLLVHNCENCEYTDPSDFVETDLYIEYQGKRIYRPFVEKPIDADDHNIFIYHTDHLIKLFRKISNKSSDNYDGIYRVRRNGCYVYEEFLDSGGRDLKIYAIYPNYALAEVRKAPHLDGIVERDSVTNKEKREQTILNDDERRMVNSVLMIMMQLICGLDILRTTDGHSYIMDVNGFSFVKGNDFYDEECSQNISTIIIQELERQKRQNYKGMTMFPQHDMYVNENRLMNKYIDKLNNVYENNHYDKYFNNNFLKLQSLISIFRHGDRAPKFKYVFCTKIQELINIFYESNEDEENKLEFRIRPEFEQERAEEIMNDLTKFIEQCSIDESTVQQHKLYEFLKVPDAVLVQFPVLYGSRKISQEEADGIRLLIFVIKKQLAGSKIQIKEQEQDNQKIYKVTVKWGGYLTIAGLRQSFQAGRQTKLTYSKQLNIEEIFIKVFHTSERRITRTAQAVTLGYLADPDVSIEEVLPFLNFSPFNQSDCICPNIFDTLQEYYVDNVVPYIHYTIPELRNFLTEDEQSLNVQSQEIKIKKQEDLRMVSKLLNNPNIDYKSPYQNSIEKIFKTCLTDLNSQFSNENFTHCEYFELIVSLLNSIMLELKYDNSIILMPYCNHAGNEKVNLIEFIAFILISFVEFDKYDHISYNVSKLTDIYELVLFLVVHYNTLMKQNQDFKQLFVIAHKYNKLLMKIMYGYSEFNTIEYGEKIGGNLLRSIEDDIEMSYNYNRRLDVQRVLFSSHSNRTSQEDNSANTSRKQSVTSNNVAVRLAQELSSENEISSTETFKLDRLEKQKKQIRLYITDDAHIYSLYHLLSSTQMIELTQFSVMPSSGLGDVNYLAELHFIYYELFSPKYYSAELKQIDVEKSMDEILKLANLPGPSKLIEISYSKGQSSDAWQPVPNNVLPIDMPELIYSMFPLININNLNTKIQRHGENDGAFELQTVIGVYRHGDRQPKQKIKIPIKNAFIVGKIMELFKISPTQPEDISLSSDKDRDTLLRNLERLKDIVDSNQVLISRLEYNNLLTFFQVSLEVPPAMKFQIKFPIPYKGEKKCTIIIKYGGTLTKLGEKQAQLSAQYLENQMQEDLLQCGNAELLQCVQVFTNDELRVKETAKIFTGHFVEVFKVKRVQMRELEILSKTDQRARVLMDQEKQLLNDALTLNVELCNTPVKSLPARVQRVVRQLDAFKIEDLGNPLEHLQEIKALMLQIVGIYQEKKEAEQIHDYDLHISRYQAVIEEFAKDEDFNVSKINDVYDMLRYEAQQSEINQIPEEILTKLRRAFELSRLLSKFSVPLEFGSSDYNRKIICGILALELIKHIAQQLESPGVSLYFVSESHIHALVKIVQQYLKIEDQVSIDFMSHLIIKIFKCKDERRMEICFSQGSFENPFKDELGSARVQQPFLLSDNLSENVFKEIYQKIKWLTDSETFGKRFNLGYDVIEQ